MEAVAEEDSIPEADDDELDRMLGDDELLLLMATPVLEGLPVDDELPLVMAIPVLDSGKLPLLLGLPVDELLLVMAAPVLDGCELLLVMPTAVLDGGEPLLLMSTPVLDGGELLLVMPTTVLDSATPVLDDDEENAGGSTQTLPGSALECCVTHEPVRK